MIREVPGLTIDDVSTRDIDDAIAIERIPDGWKIQVSIADVGRDVPLGSEIDRAAHERTATRYFASGNSPMLPRDLSEHLLSLWPKVSRFVITVGMTLSEDFQTQHVDIYEAGIRSEAKLSYAQIPGILADPAHPHHAFMKNARGLGLGLLAARRKAGALVMYDLNNGWVTTEEGSIRKLANKDDVIGHIIIQELMIRANLEVANFGVLTGIPLLFRNHEAKASPDREKLLQAIQEAATRPIEGLAELRAQTHLALKRATYGSVLTGHYGLNLPAYLHFTSPIRRYADLVNHRQIVALLRGETLPYSIDQLEEVAQHINARADQERTQQSEAFKDKAVAQAQRAIDHRRLDGLNAKDFERAVKVEARKGPTEDVSPALAEAFVRRLEEETLPLLCQTVLFAEAPKGLPGWTALREKAVAWLATHPEASVSILSQGVQAFGWPETVFTMTSVGPDHRKVWNALATFTEASRAEHSFQSWDSSAKLAKQQAAVGLLALIGQVAPPVFDVPKAEELLAPAPVLESGDNPVGQLQEYSQQKKKAPPVFSFDQKGPPHAPVITCLCSFESFEVTAVAASKKDAKQLAAKSMLRNLR